jgi:riboflavin synthase
MFTGIIESLGTIKSLRKENTNLHLEVESSLSSELKVDQSVSHNGICLTVTKIFTQSYEVTAIEETLQKTNLGNLIVGSKVNLERSMLMNGRLDGHIVQGHVDQIGTCIGVEDKDGSWIFSFEYEPTQGNVTVEKGSICINGVSLTVLNSGKGQFSVAIIPYTYEHTGFHQIKKGNQVNLEFDVIGKYVQRILSPMLDGLKLQ